MPKIGADLSLAEICQDLKTHVGEILRGWEERAHGEPWRSLSPEQRIDHLPSVVVGMAEASLCDPQDREAHRQKVAAAAEHGRTRRSQGIAEQVMLAEYHLLRQAIWAYLAERFGHSERTTDAILRIDSAATDATAASLWGYHRDELVALGSWDAGIERIAGLSPFLRGAR